MVRNHTAAVYEGVPTIKRLAGHGRLLSPLRRDPDLAPKHHAEALPAAAYFGVLVVIPQGADAPTHRLPALVPPGAVSLMSQRHIVLR